jgi:hypothetical protein
MRHAFLPLLFVTPVLAGTPQIVACVDTPASIPDDAASSVEITLDLGPPNALVVQTVQLELSIEHPWIGDLHAALTAPDGTVVTILNRPGLANPPGFDFPGPHGCGGDNINAIFTDAAPTDAQSTCSLTALPVLAGPLRPAQALVAFAGLPASGVWTLTITDLGPTDAGAFLAACLRIDTRPACLADLAAPFGSLNFFDLAAYLALFSAGDPAADLAAPFGVLNFFDLGEYLAHFNAGCP